MDKPKILIIDDDVALIESLIDILDVEGYQVETAYTAKDGIGKVEQCFYNIVLQDMRLPDSDGIKSLEKIREISPDTEVIMFTAYAATESVIEAMDKGAFSYLPKPFEMADLMTSLKKACERQTLLFENRKLFKQVLQGKKEWEITFDSIKDPISIHDVDSNIIRCNKALADKLKTTPEEIVGKKCNKVFHGRNEPFQGCAILRCIETLKPTEEETEFMGGFFLMSCFPRFDESGEFDGIVHIARDISEKKQFERQLKESEVQFRNTFEMAGVGIAHVSLNGRFLRLNKFCCDILGHSEDEIMRLLTSQDITHSNTLSKDIKFENKLITGEIKFHSEEKRFVNSDGAIIWIIIMVSLVRDTEENPKYFIFILKDITKRKEAEIQIGQGIEKIRTALNGTIEALSLTVEQRDPYTAGHQRRVSKLACAIADEMELSNDQIEGIKMAGIVHDIGKMHIPAEILSRPGKLTADEFNIVRSHAQVGYDILKGIEFPWPVADIVHQHHEYMDGSGYPQGLSNGDILMDARILCVADVVEAMSSHRPYRPSLGMDMALEEISKKKRSNFDERVVQACLKIIKEGFVLE